MRNLGVNSGLSILNAPAWVYNIVATAGSTTYVWDWPSTSPGAKYVAFSGDCNFFVNYTSTGALLPTTNQTSQSSGVEYNPTARMIPPGSTGGSLVAPSSGIVSLSFWGI